MYLALLYIFLLLTPLFCGKWLFRQHVEDIQHQSDSEETTSENENTSEETSDKDIDSGSETDLNDEEDNTECDCEDSSNEVEIEVEQSNQVPISSDETNVLDCDETKKDR